VRSEKFDDDDDDDNSNNNNNNNWSPWRCPPKELPVCVGLAEVGGPWRMCGSKVHQFHGNRECLEIAYVPVIHSTGEPDY
jgi:hypothetical protein